jgi:hypothetical protein
MAVIPFRLGRSSRKPVVNGDRRQARLFDLQDMSERARLNGDRENADRLLLAAWASFDD